MKAVARKVSFLGVLGMICMAASSALAGSIEVTVRDDPRGTAVQGVRVVVSKWTQAGWSWVSDNWTDQTGKANFSDLGAGTYNVWSGRLDEWTQQYERLTRNYYPEFYEDIPGAWFYDAEATPLVLKGSGTVKVEMKLSASPISLAIRTVNPELPPDGGRVLFQVKVKNWTNARLSLKLWGYRGWYNASGLNVQYPLEVRSFTIEGQAVKTFTYWVTVPSYAEGNGYLHVQAGPSTGAVWNVYAKELSYFQKLPPAP